MNNSYGCLVCFHFLPLLPDVLTVGRPLLPEAPEPPYLSLSHELKSHWQLSRGIMELSCAAHCTAPQGSLSPPKEKSAIRTSLSISYSKHGRSRQKSRREHWEPLPTQLPASTSKMADNPVNIRQTDKVKSGRVLKCNSYIGRLWTCL